MSLEEFYQIIETGTFEVSIRGYYGKQFGLKFEETLEFANRFKDIGAIVEVKLPRDQLSRIADFTHVDPFIFKSGTITRNIEPLEEFNKIIREIKHKF